MPWLGRWGSCDPKLFLYIAREVIYAQQSSSEQYHDTNSQAVSNFDSNNADFNTEEINKRKSIQQEKPLTPSDFNVYLYVWNNSIIYSDLNGEEPVEIGHVYVIRGTLEGKPVVYTGSTAQSLRARFSKHEWKTLIKSESTTIEGYVVKAELNVAASGQGTIRSAANEALRSAEQVVLKRRRAEAGLAELNESEAALESNVVKWGDTHNVKLGARFNLKVAGSAAMYGFAALQILQIFIMWRDEKLSQYVMAPYLLEDTQGVFTINEQDRGVFRSNKYFKNYKTGSLAGQRVEITEDEFLNFKAEAEALWGTTDWKGDWVPGLLRRELPVIDRCSIDPNCA